MPGAQDRAISKCTDLLPQKYQPSFPPLGRRTDLEAEGSESNGTDLGLDTVLEVEPAWERTSPGPGKASSPLCEFTPPRGEQGWAARGTTRRAGLS